MSMSNSQTIRSVVVTPPATEPLTIHEAKRHVEIAATNNDHDVILFAHLSAAREQWERDTGKALVSRAMRLTLPYLQEIQFDVRPVTAISSITYYDGANTLQTLNSSLYQLDAADGRLKQSYLATWPTSIDRWDAWQVNYTAGSHVDSSTVPFIDKQAMLLYVGYLFRGNRGDDDRSSDLRAYEALVHRHMRSTYP